MKAECIAQYKQLEGILDKGDIVEIETILSKKDKVVRWKFEEDPEGAYMWRGRFVEILDGTAKGKRYIRSADVIQPKGSYIDWRFKSKNSHYYRGNCITKRIGMKTLFDLFKKI